MTNMIGTYYNIDYYLFYLKFYDFKVDKFSFLNFNNFVFMFMLNVYLRLYKIQICHIFINIPT